jgi:hypothetical protein
MIAAWSSFKMHHLLPVEENVWTYTSCSILLQLSCTQKSEPQHLHTATNAGGIILAHFHPTFFYIT